MTNSSLCCGGGGGGGFAVGVSSSGVCCGGGSGAGCSGGVRTATAALQRCRQRRGPMISFNEKQHSSCEWPPPIPSHS